MPNCFVVSEDRVEKRPQGFLNLSDEIFEFKPGLILPPAFEEVPQKRSDLERSLRRLFSSFCNSVILALNKIASADGTLIVLCKRGGGATLRELISTLTSDWLKQLHMPEVRIVTTEIPSGMAPKPA